MNKAAEKPINIILPITLESNCNCIQVLQGIQNISMVNLKPKISPLCSIWLKQNTLLKTVINYSTLLVHITRFKAYDLLFNDYLFKSMYYRTYSKLQNHTYDLMLSNDVNSYINILIDEFKIIIQHNNFIYSTTLYTTQLRKYYAEAFMDFKKNVVDKYSYTEEDYFTYINPIIALNKNAGNMQQCALNIANKNLYIICVPLMNTDMTDSNTIKIN